MSSSSMPPSNEVPASPILPASPGSSSEAHTPQPQLSRSFGLDGPALPPASTSAPSARATSSYVSSAPSTSTHSYTHPFPLSSTSMSYRPLPTSASAPASLPTSSSATTFAPEDSAPLYLSHPRTTSTAPTSTSLLFSSDATSRPATSNGTDVDSGPLPHDALAWRGGANAIAQSVPQVAPAPHSRPNNVSNVAASGMDGNSPPPLTLVPEQEAEGMAMMVRTSGAASRSTNEAWKRRRQMLLDQVREHEYVGLQLHGIRPSEGLLQRNDPKLRDDIMRIISQYLADEGFTQTSSMLEEEANVKNTERDERVSEGKKLKKAILDGDWAEVDKLCSRPLVKNHKAFLYAVYKQQFLEHVEHREFQKAFTFLNKRLKPLEHYQPTPNEFRDLCYLLSAKTVTDAPSFSNWEGIGPAREKLVEQFRDMLEIDRLEREGSVYVPPHRLVTLLNQAVAYQIEFSRYHPKKAPKVNTLLEDYASFIVPNAVHSVMKGHRKNVKCVRFVGDEGRQIVSGSSDNTVRLWDTSTSRCLSILEGHTSRVWDVDATRSGSLLASASADGTVKIWDAQKRVLRESLGGSKGDMYSVRFHPSKPHAVAGGYDKLVRMYDLHTGTVIKTFTGHQLGVSSTIFNPLGNLIVTGSKDTTIRFWDAVSGLCIRTITSHLGEVTSVEMNESGTMLISSSKDNSNRLWDVRMLRPLRRFKGHQNTSKNFIRSSFAHTSLLVGGSEDGTVYLWDQESSEVLQTLRGHTGTAYGAVWNKQQNLLVSCGDDAVLRSWTWDERTAEEEEGRQEREEKEREEVEEEERRARGG